jgi:hypothetical protein
MLALCLWLAWAALDYNSRQADTTGMVEVNGCGCTMRQVTDWGGRIEFAARDGSTAWLHHH